MQWEQRLLRGCDELRSNHSCDCFPVHPLALTGCQSPPEVQGWDWDQQNTDSQQADDRGNKEKEWTHGVGTAAAAAVHPSLINSLVPSTDACL